MPVFIESTKIYSELTSQPVNWLLANIGDKIIIEHDFNVRTWAMSTEDDPIILNPPDRLGNDWIVDPSGRFAGFQVGDSIAIISDNTIVHTILEKDGDTAIRTTANWGASTGASPEGTVFSVATPITSVKYRWNFIENNEPSNFKSKIDSSEQRLIKKVTSATDLTVQPMEFFGAKTYQTGSATIQGVSAGYIDKVYTSKFKLIHYTTITPFMLAEQWDDLQSGTTPDYFFDEKCLKGIFQIEAAKDFNDPNWVQQIEITEILGNTGWYNENFNSGITDYYIDSVVYKNAASEVLEALELTEAETTVEITVKNSSAVFSNNNTKFVLNFCKAPSDENEYRGNNRTVDQNFVHDRALQTVGSAAVNGQNNGTGYQVLKNISAELVSASEIKITAKVSLGSDAVNVLMDSEEARYMLFVAVQDHTLQTKLADKVTLLIDAQPFYIDASDPGMIQIENRFLRHPDSPIAAGTESITVFPEDEVVAKTRFYIDREGREDDEIILRSAEARVKVKHESGQQFILDSFRLDLSGFPVINNAQYSDFSINRIFRIPESDVRKKIILRRAAELDVDQKYYYEFLFPFMVRWEYWQPIAQAAGAFFTTSQPNNGWNHNWHRYTTAAGWSMYFETRISASKNGSPLTYSNEQEIISKNYNSNSQWISESIKAYDADSGLILFDSGQQRNFIYGYKNTRIEVLMTKVGAAPVAGNIVVVPRIEVFEEGGIEGSRRMSSKWESVADTWFISPDDNNKSKVTITGNTVKTEVFTDFSKLPDKRKFKISARLYEYEDAAGGDVGFPWSGKLTEDGQLKLAEDSEVKTVE
jgi:hypothetical protein